MAEDKTVVFKAGSRGISLKSVGKLGHGIVFPCTLQICYHLKNQIQRIKKMPVQCSDQR